jgi:enamine deaminase RidA (YjgF/YER057c/UK114 family)
MKFICLSLLVFVQLSAFAQSNTSIIKFNNPSVVYPGRGYSQTVSVDLANCTMLVLSGQVAFDKNGNLVGKDDLAKQTEQIFSNIKSIVEDAGGSMSQLIKLNFYILDVSQIQAIRNIRDKFINTAQPPASTLVQVSKLFRDDVLIEIEATAIIPKKK